MHSWLMGGLVEVPGYTDIHADWTSTRLRKMMLQYYIRVRSFKNISLRDEKSCDRCLSCVRVFQIAMANRDNLRNESLVLAKIYEM